MLLVVANNDLWERVFVLVYSWTDIPFAGESSTESVYGEKLFERESLTIFFTDACSLAALKELRLLPLEVLVIDKFLLEGGLKLFPYLAPDKDVVVESCDGRRSFTRPSASDDFALLLDTLSDDFVVSFVPLKEEWLRLFPLAVLREERDCESLDRAASFRSFPESPPDARRDD